MESGVALVTPFDSNGAVDVQGLTQVVEYNINGGVDYLVVLGTTAESATLNHGREKIGHEDRIPCERWASSFGSWGWGKQYPCLGSGASKFGFYGL